MQLITAPIAIGLAFLTALIFGLVAQRLLGIRLGFVRVIIAGVVAMTINGPLMLGVLGNLAERPPTSSEVAPLLALGLVAADHEVGEGAADVDAGKEGCVHS